MTPTQQIIDEAHAMLAVGNTDDCVRYTGEELARADNDWRKAHNAGAARDIIIERLRDVLTLTALHNMTLRRSNLADEALATGAGALMAVTIEDAVPDLEHDTLTTVDAMLADLEQCAAMLPDDEVTEQHIPVIIRYLASIEYALYTRLSADGGPTVNAAYSRLQTLVPAGAVESPTVTTPDGPADPLHPLPIMNDLLGRLAAAIPL